MYALRALVWWLDLLDVVLLVVIGLVFAVCLLLRLIGFGWGCLLCFD